MSGTTRGILSATAVPPCSGAVLGQITSSSQASAFWSVIGYQDLANLRRITHERLQQRPGSQEAARCLAKAAIASDLADSPTQLATARPSSREGTEPHPSPATGVGCFPASLSSPRWLLGPQPGATPSKPTHPSVKHLA